jgi:hypothetical protein
MEDRMRGIGLGLTIAMLTAGAAPAWAAAQHDASLAAPASKSRIVVHGLLWTCSGQRCTATAASDSRPVIVCMALARELGTVLGFSTGSVALNEADLARCNMPRHKEGTVSSR